MSSRNPEERNRGLARALLDAYGPTYAERAGIRLSDDPAPLYQLLVLTLLSSARIRADTAVATARELFNAGWRTPEGMRGATWQQRADALDRGGYGYLDKGTSTTLGENADWLIRTHDGDLRRLRRTDGGVQELTQALTEVPRVSPVGAEIFVREVQGVWPEVGPFFGERAVAEAGRLGLPTDPKLLAELAPRSQIAQLADALLRSGPRPAR